MLAHFFLCRTKNVINLSPLVRTILIPSCNEGGSPQTATTLVDGVFTSGAAISSPGDVDWYTFVATSGQTYSLTWDEAYGSGSYTCDIKVSAFQSDGSTSQQGF
ncbi:hypothetical protein FACS189494_02940 [Spirochaetia bacterium]|nr:hypothetical protein FACS189494_02940 [Spirochaetia bacterium]